ncbi:hypothetical protein SAMN05660710_00142 [Paracoccus tibetensis]|uniref:Uncharacterized protein n=1 Tax=Paracoccus tibetensis TaxID=336292 RepID=A0A1G5BHL1_9RHOB|nr:hypothetical protein SAMN05660710_00142 [Paracoccus tibetensis]
MSYGAARAALLAPGGAGGKPYRAAVHSDSSTASASSGP